MPFRRSIFALLVSTPLFVMTSRASAQSTTHLILNDGSYQIVSKYELEGDRVHYYSVERGEWEDVPSSMVNWEATRQYASDSSSGKNSPNAKALAKEMEAEREVEEAQSPHVAPGLRLPQEGGVYALDTYLNEPELSLSTKAAGT
jgi:hypothetical protein